MDRLRMNESVVSPQFVMEEIITAEEARELSNIVNNIADLTEYVLEQISKQIKEVAITGKRVLEFRVNFRVSQSVTELLEKQGFSVKGYETLTIKW